MQCHDYTLCTACLEDKRDQVAWVTHIIFKTRQLQHSIMSNYKLIYFNSRGRAEASRYIFAQAGVEYEDKRVDKEEWLQLKPSTPTGMLPILKVDGKTLIGGGVISRFLAERFGLAGSNDLENAEIAGIIDVLNDFWLRLMTVHLEKDEARKAQLNWRRRYSKILGNH